MSIVWGKQGYTFDLLTDGITCGDSLRLSPSLSRKTVLLPRRQSSARLQKETRSRRTHPGEQGCVHPYDSEARTVYLSSHERADWINDRFMLLRDSE